MIGYGIITGVKRGSLFRTAAVVAAALTASACGSSSSDAPSAAATSSSAPPPIVEPTTPPGTSLTVGQRAVVNYSDGIDEGLLAITVTAIEQADQNEFRTAFGDKAQGLTPYCIRYTVENLTGTDFGTKVGPTLEALVGDGETTGTFITGDIPSCAPRLSPGDFDHPGARYENADLDATSPDDPVVAARYDGNDYDGNPLVWRMP